MDEKKRRLPLEYNPSGVLASLFFAGFSSFLLVVSLLPRRLYVLWTQESGPVEQTTAVLAFLGAYFSGVSFFQRRKIYGQSHYFLLLTAFLFFFIGMEEISWGQRIFGIAPVLMGGEANYQRELTFHNLQYGDFIVYYGGFAFIFVWAGVLPLFTYFSKKAKTVCIRLGMPLMPRLIFIFMWLGFIGLVFIPRLRLGTQGLFNPHVGGNVLGAIYEIRELYFTFAFFSYFLADYFYLLKFKHAYEPTDIRMVR